MAVTTSITSPGSQSQASLGNLGYKVTLQKVASALMSLLYTLTGFSVLIGGWHLISIITEGELPTPIATFKVFWEMIKDPFYDLGANDKGIGLQLFASIGRVFTGFLIGSL